MSLLVIAAAACGGDSVGVDDFEGELVNAFCANAVSCGSMPDAATCKAAILVKDKDFATVLAKAKSGAISYSSDKAGECIDRIESATCTFDGFYSTGANSCTEVFTGKVAAGGACLVDEECAGGGSCQATDPDCDTDTMCCPGTCQAVPAKVAIGGDCSTASCVDEAYCSSTDKCTAPITTAGTACDNIAACANPMYCDIFMRTPTCVKPAGRNETCDPSVLIPCADGRDYCDTATMKCTPEAAVGEACDGANGAECVDYAECTNMSCAALPAAGGSCTVDPQSMRNNCLGDLSCTANGGACTLPTAATACTRMGFTSPSSDSPSTQPSLFEARRALRALDDKRATARLGWLPQLRD